MHRNGRDAPQAVVRADRDRTVAEFDLIVPFSAVGISAEGTRPAEKDVLSPHISTFLSVRSFLRGLHARDHFVGRPHSVGEKSVVDHRCLIAVAPHWMPGSSGCVLDNCDLEALFQQLAQMVFDAHVRQHAAEDHLTDAALAQLENEVVGLRAAVRYCLR